MDYNKEFPVNIQIVPDEADYNKMKESFIYGQPLDFKELIVQMKKLQEQFRAIDAHK